MKKYIWFFALFLSFFVVSCSPDVGVPLPNTPLYATEQDAQSSSMGNSMPAAYVMPSVPETSVIVIPTSTANVYQVTLINPDAGPYYWYNPVKEVTTNADPFALEVAPESDSDPFAGGEGFSLATFPIGFFISLAIAIAIGIRSRVTIVESEYPFVLKVDVGRFNTPDNEEVPGATYQVRVKASLDADSVRRRNTLTEEGVLEQIRLSLAPWHQEHIMQAAPTRVITDDAGNERKFYDLEAHCMIMARHATAASFGFPQDIGYDFQNLVFENMNWSEEQEDYRQKAKQAAVLADAELISARGHGAGVKEFLDKSEMKDAGIWGAFVYAFIKNGIKIDVNNKNNSGQEES